MPRLDLQWVNESIDRGADPLMRAPIRQLTNSPLVSWGIYCEQIYASTDGRRIAFIRRQADRPSEQEIWIADLDSYRIARVGPTCLYLVASTPLMDQVYYVRPEGRDGQVLVRLDLRTLEADDVLAFGDCPPPGTPAVSSDERWFASNHLLHDNVYGLYRVDLRASRWEYFHEERDICNTHLQFEPARGRDLLVQHNRGYAAEAAGRPQRLSGPEGTALYVIDIDGGNRRDLPLGPPHTGAVDGHQCWIGSSGRVLAAVGNPLEVGGQCVLTPGDAAATTILPGFCFIHVCASADGRLIVGDHGGHRYVYLGSLQTGKVVHFCECPCSRSGGHETWEEPYITPDNRHIIFNSDRTGHAELYAATIPPHVMAYLNTR